MVQTNFFGFVRLVKNVLPLMGKRKRGTVVAIGSILGEMATPFQGFYNASKAALHSYTETLRMECQPLNVKVVLIAPGSIKSNISAVSSLPIQTYRKLRVRNLHIPSPRTRSTSRSKSRSSTSCTHFSYYPGYLSVLIHISGTRARPRIMV